MGPGQLLPNIDPETVMNKYHGETKKKMDREYVVWCCKASKPLSMAEQDKYFKRFCASISLGRYTPPCKKICAHELITLVAASREILKGQIKEVLEDDCLDISISGDIWSENGIALFVIMGYWIDKGFVFHEKVNVLCCVVCYVLLCCVY